MSRKAMVLLLVAILAVHVLLLCLFLATDSAERQLGDTRRELEEENALRSAWDQTQEAASQSAPTAQSVTPKPVETSQADPPKQTTSPAQASTTKPSTASTSASAQTKPATSSIPVVASSDDEKNVPSVPSTT